MQPLLFGSCSSLFLVYQSSRWWRLAELTELASLRALCVLYAKERKLKSRERSRYSGSVPK